MLFGLALHAADIQQRYRRNLMPLDKYQSPRIIEWLLSSLILFAAAAASLGLLEILGAWRSGEHEIVRFQAFVGAALTSVALAYVALRGASWVQWAKEEFLQSPGATATENGQVMVRVAQEAIYDARIMRRVAWPVYALAAAVMILAAAISGSRALFLLPVGLLLSVTGAALIWVLLSGLPKSEEDEPW